MKNFLTHIFVFVLLSVTLTGCDVIGDIFEAGIWAGVIIVVLVIVFIIWIIKKFIS